MTTSARPGKCWRCNWLCAYWSISSACATQASGIPTRASDRANRIKRTRTLIFMAEPEALTRHFAERLQMHIGQTLPNPFERTVVEPSQPQVGNHHLNRDDGEGDRHQSGHSELTPQAQSERREQDPQADERLAEIDA